MTASVHNIQSSFREMLLEHLFVGEVLRLIWSRDDHAEVLKPEVDDAGYDIVIESRQVMRHIQLKASFVGSKTARVNINVALAKKPSGCVIWLVFDPESLAFKEYRWFGGKPGKPLRSLRGLQTGRHTKGDATGTKAERPNIRVVPKSKFKTLTNIEDVVTRLFG